MKTVKIGDLEIGGQNIPRFIAEIGVNHLGDVERMKNMIDLALEAKADFLKFQTYIAEKRYDLSNNPKAEEFTKLVTPWQFSKKDEIKIWEYAKSKGAKVFTSVYDIESVDFAYDLGTIAFKIASFEINNHKLIKKIAEKKLPVIISCGMANYNEIDNCTNILKESNIDYILLHCISSYPLEKKYSRLIDISNLDNRYNCPIGHSDHTYGSEIVGYAVAAGAKIIEKHFTDNIKLRLSDNFFSVTCEEVKEIQNIIKKTHKYLYNFDKSTEDFMKNFKKYSE
jgi:N,N'-diacetyllegionaminate synthase